MGKRTPDKAVIWGGGGSGGMVGRSQDKAAILGEGAVWWAGLQIRRPLLIWGAGRGEGLKWADLQIRRPFREGGGMVGRPSR